MVFNLFISRSLFRLGLCGLCILAHYVVSAQRLDSLEAALAQEKNVAKRVELLKVVGEGKMNEVPKEAIAYFEELVTISRRTDDKLLRAFALNRIGNCWLNLNNQRKSITFYFQALESTENEPEFDDIRARLYNNLGWSFKKLEEYEKALQYFKESETYARRVGVKSVLGLILNNKGVTQKDLKRLDEALVSLEESLQLNRETQNKRQERFNLNNIAVILNEKKQFSEAVERLLQLETLNEELRDTVELINNLENLGTAYAGLNQYSDAERVFFRAEALANRTNNSAAKIRVRRQLSTLYQKQGKFAAALEYYKGFYVLSDSLQAQETRRYALELESKYNSLMRERELETARKELAEQRLFLTWIIGALLIAVVVAIFFWRMILLKRKNERVLIDLNHEIEAQSEELRQANEEILAINDNLEKLVAQRTEVISSQNERLRQFAFMNAHKIRGPVATILGLANLMADGRNERISKELLEHLQTTTQNLDKIVHKVNRQLQDNGDAKVEQGVDAAEVSGLVQKSGDRSEPTSHLGGEF